jgi:hypothetical protein
VTRGHGEGQRNDEAIVRCVFEKVLCALSFSTLYGAMMAMAGSKVAIGASRREAVTEINS